LAAETGAAHCIAVSNATLGLQLAVRALGIEGEAIVPSFTFPATVHALAWEGVAPVFCDVDQASHTLDVAAVERAIGPQTRAIVGVHAWGQPCDVEALEELARRRGLKLLLDAAHAWGCSHRGRMIGNFGDAEVFSFHATKFVCAGEGGAIATNDDDLAARLRRLRNFGLQGTEVVELGVNAKMSELAAALALTSLESQAEFVDRNRENFAAYERALAGAPGLRMRTARSADRRNFQYVVVEVDPAAAQADRDQIVAALHRQNVLAKRYFWPGCPRLPPYQQAYAARRQPLATTERLCQRLLQLPTGLAVTPAEAARIGDYLHGLLRRRRAA
ncbi:MAG TPA: DegT/DnrJ/EryC1/StrS family aminotransferase, partial [Lacipirellulaceae bacterium]|nr:DegT/DnrJ/EryC1/StrS family aminotransferase [Lacipirellulaceae bacterium]